MNFLSFAFLTFFPVVLLLYWLLPAKTRPILLLIASYFFYISWNFWLVFLIFGTTCVSFFTAKGIARSQTRGMRVFLLSLTLILCLGCLAIFKYLNFFAANVTALIHLFGGRTEDFVFSLILPVGISFYTFQTLSYVIDVYRGKISCEPRFDYYALYISFFPQLVAGPIERPEHLIPQLRARHRFDAEDMAVGFRWMLRGFCKKAVIADLLAGIVESVYAQPSEANGAAVLIATVLFALQIYCDFSGYSEIALGTARMLGIRLMENFDRPYLAVGIADFWRRWHISLTSWFTDYLYIPLGGNRKGLLRRCINTLIVFFVSGLWHGANWTFVVWGMLHGCYLVAALFLKKPWERLLTALRIPQRNAVYRGVVRLFTFALVCFAWIFFRAATLSDAAILLERLFTAWDTNCWSAAFRLFDVAPIRLLLIPLCVALLCLLRRMPEETVHLPVARKAERALAEYYLLLAVALAWFILLASGTESSFIYFQF